MDFFSKRFLAPTSTAIFSVICCCRWVFRTSFRKFRQKPIRIRFQIGSDFFGRGEKMHLKKMILAIFAFFSKQFFAPTSAPYFLVIWKGRSIFQTSFIKFRQKPIRIRFQIGSNYFGRGQKMHLKKMIFGYFWIFFQSNF